MHQVNTRNSITEVMRKGKSVQRIMSETVNILNKNQKGNREQDCLLRLIVLSYEGVSKAAEDTIAGVDIMKISNAYSGRSYNEIKNLVRKTKEIVRLHSGMELP